MHDEKAESKRRALLPQLCGASFAHAQLRGHRGPVSAVAVSHAGQSAISGSFDTSAIVGSLASNNAEAVLRFHDGAVNAVALGRPHGYRRRDIWCPEGDAPVKVLEGDRGPIVALGIAH